jgi:hypothetical protein
MWRVIDTAELWKHAAAGEEGSVFVEMDGSISSAGGLWRMVLAMAMNDHAWCIQYDVNHPLRLMYVTSRQVYGLVPPPDEMADNLVRTIDRVTRSPDLFDRIFSAARSCWSRRVTRSFCVRQEGEAVPWVASWPRRASDGPIVLFRETYPGPDPSVDAAGESGPL